MTATNRFGLSTEAIAYQGESMLFKELTLACEQIRFKSEEATACQTIDKVIARHTGLKVKTNVEEFFNAYAVPPVLNRNHPFVQRFKDYGPDVIESHILSDRKTRRLVEEATAGIDLKRGRVSGVFSEVESRMCLGRQLWTLGGLTAQEVAAILLHELGHVFTFLERVTTTVTTNIAITTAVEALGKSADRNERIRIIENLNTIAGLDVKNAEELADRNDRKTYESVFVKKTVEAFLPSATGNVKYELSGSELAADQFAARHGAGIYLVKALDKFDSSHYMAKWAFVTLEVIKAVWFILISIAAVGIPVLLALLVLIWGDYNDRTYDTPVDRAKRIRNDLVQSLKSRRIDKRLRAELLDDIEAIDKIIGLATDRKSLMNLLWLAVSSKRRKESDDRVFQQELEKIINNDLFVQSSRLSSLTA